MMTGARDQVSILLAIRHPLFLRGLADLLTEQRGMCVVASCSDGLEAFAKARALAPDLCILDYQLAHMNAVAFIRDIHAHSPTTKTIVLTGCSTHEPADVALDAGSDGVFSKADAPEALLKCIWRVMASPDSLLTSETGRGALGLELETSLPPAGEELTRREAEIAAHVSAGLSSKEVARRLQLSEGTVKVHLSNIYRKLGVCNRTALAYVLSRTDYEFVSRSIILGSASR